MSTNVGLGVEYVQHLGTDLTVVNAARVSFGVEAQKLTEKDAKLINYLAAHKHYTPFEHCSLTVKVTCPLYIRSQIMRHRTFSYNEISRRYTDEDLRFYQPLQLRHQHKSSKQCSAGELEPILNRELREQMRRIERECLEQYEQLIEHGVARELARSILPQSLVTEFYMTGNLRNWCAFLELRLDSHAQLEAQLLSKDIAGMVADKFPVAGKALLKSLEVSNEK